MKTIVITTTMINTGKAGVTAYIMHDGDLVQTIKNILESNAETGRRSDSTYYIGAELSNKQIANSDVKVLVRRSTQDHKSAAIELKKLLLANSTGALTASITSGHLASNGGLRGHSAGDIFPWRVMGQGTFDAMRYWLIDPAGEKHGTPFFTPAAAMSLGRHLAKQ